MMRTIAAITALAALAGCGPKQQAQPAMPGPAAVAAKPDVVTATPARWPFDSIGAEAGQRGEFDAAAAMRRNYYFVFDASGSMADRKCSGNETKIDVAKRAFAEFAGKLPADVNFGILVFDGEGIREIVALRPLDRGVAQSALAPVRPAGGTPLAQAIRQAYGQLTKQGQQQLGYGEYHLVVVTDGEATGENPSAVVRAVIESSPVVLHTIGFCIGETHSLNQPGRVVYHSANSPQELAQGLAEVLAEAPSFDVKAFK